MIPTYETVPVEFDCGGCGPAECGTELLGRFDALRPLQTFVLTSREDPVPLLARLQAERPELFEWSPLQEGPRVWRVEIARRKSQPGEAREITEALEWDHDRLDRLERTAFDAWAAGDLREAEAAFALFAHGLRRHIGFEEALIFPEFERRTGVAPSSGPTMTMRTEHRQTYCALTTGKRKRCSTRSRTASSRAASAMTSCAESSSSTRHDATRKAPWCRLRSR